MWQLTVSRLVGALPVNARILWRVMSDVDEADGAYRRLVVVRVRVRDRDRVRVSGQASRRVGMFCLVRLLPALAAALVPQLGLTPLRGSERLI